MWAISDWLPGTSTGRPFPCSFFGLCLEERLKLLPLLRTTNLHMPVVLQRLLVHRVCNFYGLETCKVVEGVHQGKILASRTSRTRLPLVSYYSFDILFGLLRNFMSSLLTGRLWFMVQVKLADSVKMVERGRGGPDAPRTLQKKSPKVSRDSIDNDSGRRMAASTSRDSTAHSEAAALEALHRPKVQSHKGQKGDRELARAALSGLGPLGLRTRLTLLTCLP